MKENEIAGVSVNEGSLILVNREHPYRAIPDRLVPAASGTADCLLMPQTAEKLSLLISKIRGEDAIAYVSGWRSVEEQCRIWNNSIRENGDAYTRKYVAAPGGSEHHTGLAIDLARNTDNIDFICPDFPEDGIYGDFRDLAAEYGFIQRYPAGKEEITGISCEPWHFRYVGVPHAQVMEHYGFVLEEYILFLRNWRYPEKKLTWITKRAAYAISFLHQDAEISSTELYGQAEISGNNIDGWIITEQVK